MRVLGPSLSSLEYETFLLSLKMRYRNGIDVTSVTTCKTQVQVPCTRSCTLYTVHKTVIRYFFVNNEQ